MISENSIFTTPQYNTIESVEAIFDGNDTYVEKEDLKLTPLQVIKGMAKTLGQEIGDPKSNCKHCYGLGYVGRDSESKAPIPCMCLYSKDAVVANNHVKSRMHHKSRSERREYQRLMKKQISKQNKILKQMGGVEVDNI